MCIGINRDGWQSAVDGREMCDIAACLSMDETSLTNVLGGEEAPDVHFIAKSLRTFPMMFMDLFTVSI